MAGASFNLYIIQCPKSAKCITWDNNTLVVVVVDVDEPTAASGTNNKSVVTTGFARLFLLFRKIRL